MKKRGFTLIELVVVLCILSCIMSISTLSYKFIKKVQDEQNVELSIRDIDDTITFARLYCLKNKSEGNILFDKQTGEYYFFIGRGGSNLIRKEKINGPIKFCGNTFPCAWQIRINSYGVVSAGTISLMDNNKKLYEISVGVGNYNEEIH